MPIWDLWLRAESDDALDLLWVEAACDEAE
jgi:hypothetical protein